MTNKESLDRVLNEIGLHETKIKENQNILEKLNAQKIELETKIKEESAFEQQKKQQLEKLAQTKTDIQEEINRLLTKQQKIDDKIEQTNLNGDNV